MTGDAILIRSVTGLPEAALVDRACALLASVLEATSGKPWTVTCAHDVDLADASALPARGVLLTSLLPEAERLDQPWAMTEQRLFDLYHRLTRDPDVTVFICTVFRHVADSDDPARDLAIRVRIRRLNLAATEISRQTGAHVLDLDRTLADLGGEALGTDYRLLGGGDAAVEAIAAALVASGLDQELPYQTQSAAQALLASRSSQGVTPTAVAGPAWRMRVGRKAQTVERLAVGPDQTAAFLKAALRGELPLADVVARVSRAVARRGAASVARTVVSGALRAAAARSRRQTGARP